MAEERPDNFPNNELFSGGFSVYDNGPREQVLLLFCIYSMTQPFFKHNEEDTGHSLEALLKVHSVILHYIIKVASDSVLWNKCCDSSLLNVLPWQKLLLTSSRLTF